MPSNNLRIRTIFLDIGDVLVYVNKDHIVNDLSRRFGIERSLLTGKLLNNLEIRFERGEISTGEYLQEAGKALNRSPEDVLEEIEAVIIRWFTPNPYAMAQLPHLKEKYRIYLLSNTNPLHIRILEKMCGLENRVNGALYSFALNALKPETDIYKKALNVTGSEPGQTLFIDDRCDNIEGAKQVGLHAVRFSSNLQLMRDLKRFGIHLIHPVKLRKHE